MKVASYLSSRVIPVLRLHSPNEQRWKGAFIRKHCHEFAVKEDRIPSLLSDVTRENDIDSTPDERRNSFDTMSHESKYMIGEEAEAETHSI
jgi:hypothetical protein